MQRPNSNRPMHDTLFLVMMSQNSKPRLQLKSNMVQNIVQFQICPKNEKKSNYFCHFECTKKFPVELSQADYFLSSSFDHTVTTSFAETKKTSSYLIAFVVSDFEYKSAQSTKGFLHRVFSAPPLVETAQFAATKGEQVLSALEQYLKVDFSLPKMDQVALADFNAGGLCIENFYFLFDFDLNSCRI